MSTEYAIYTPSEKNVYYLKGKITIMWFMIAGLVIASLGLWLC